MSVVSLPSVFRVTQFALTQMVNMRAFASPYVGSEQVVDMLNDRWKAQLQVNMINMVDAAVMEAFINTLRMGVNVVNLYHYARPVPRGTMRGTLALTAAAIAGASTLSFSGAGQAGTTLLAGDLINVGALLLMVAADATADGTGAITVTLTNRLRVAQSLSAAVTWNQPTAPFRLVGTPSVAYINMRANSFMLDFNEAV